MISKKKTKNTRVIWRKSGHEKSRSYFKVISCFAIHQNKQIKKTRKSTKTNNTVFIYNSSATLESFFMHRCTIRISTHDHTQHYTTPSLSAFATPQTSSFCFKPIPPPSCRSLFLYQPLCSSVTQFLPHPRQISAIILKYRRTFWCGDSIPPLGSRSSKSISQLSWFPWILLMELFNCLKSLYKHRWFPSKAIITCSSNKVL
jgi:hypothetical protein